MTNVQAKPRRRWTPAEWRTFALYLSSFAALFLMGYIVGQLS